MAEKKSGGGGSDIWWFLGLLAVFFILWVSSGGPEIARQKGLDDVRLGERMNQNRSTPNDNNQNTPVDKTPTYVDGKIIY